MDYAGLAKIANKILLDHGATATLKRTTTATYNSSTSTASVAEANETVRVAVFPYPDKMIDGTMILVGDKQVIMSALTTTAPKPTDVLAWAGFDYTIISVKDLAPAGISVIHELQIRK